MGQFFGYPDWENTDGRISLKFSLLCRFSGHRIFVQDRNICISIGFGLGNQTGFEPKAISHTRSSGVNGD